MVLSMKAKRNEMAEAWNICFYKKKIVNEQYLSVYEEKMKLMFKTYLFLKW